MRSAPSAASIRSPPAVKVPAKTSALAFWVMLMKPPAPANRPPNRLTLTLPCVVGLRHAEAGEVKPAAVVEVELLVLGDDGARVDGRAEIEPALRQAADDPGLGGERHLLQQVLLLGHRRHGLGHADAEIDHAAHRQLHGTAAGDDLALVQGQARMRSSGTRS